MGIADVLLTIRQRNSVNYKQSAFAAFSWFHQSTEAWCTEITAAGVVTN